MAILVNYSSFSYSAYLIHTIFIFVQVYNRLSIMHYQSSIIFNIFISQTILTLLASIFTVVIIEMPCQTFEKQIRKYYKHKQQIRINRQNYGTIN
jgi:peptidoglycan/LPS O-acetylase OafA/YrhL